MKSTVNNCTYIVWKSFYFYNFVYLCKVYFFADLPIPFYYLATFWLHYSKLINAVHLTVPLPPQIKMAMVIRGRADTTHKEILYLQRSCRVLVSASQRASRGYSKIMFAQDFRVLSPPIPPPPFPFVHPCSFSSTPPAPKVQSL